MQDKDGQSGLIQWIDTCLLRMQAIKLFKRVCVLVYARRHTIAQKCWIWLHGFYWSEIRSVLVISSILCMANRQDSFGCIPSP